MDNMSVQVVPPTATVVRSEDFTTGAGAMTAGVAESVTGSWAAANGRLGGTPTTGSDTAIQLLNLSGIDRMAATSLLELSASFQTAGFAGIVFDRYSDTDFKFAAIDVAAKQVLIGHRTASGWTIDAQVAHAGLNPTANFKLGVSIKGSSVSVTLNDQAALGYVFNAVGADGRFGLFTRGGSASFDAVTVKTNDPAVPATLLAAAPAGAAALSAPALQVDQAEALLGAALARWAAVEDGLHLAALAGLRVAVEDLPDGELASYRDGTITLDIDAAGHGWFVDPTPRDDGEFEPDTTVLAARAGSDAAGRIDLLSVLAHEMGHAMGLGHGDGGVMAAELMPGQRATPDLWGRLDGTATAWGGDSAWRDAPRTTIDWTAAPRPAADGPARSAAPLVAAKAWQQRFVNQLGASAERAQPNASLRLHLPVAGELTAKMSRL
jgi:hypothetical protein